MKLFIDSADVEEIRQGYSWGIVDGVTTNPSLLKKALEKRKGRKANLDSSIKEILTIARGTPVSLEVTDLTTEGMIRQGKALFRRYNPVARNVCIKIPVNPAFGKGGLPFAGIAAIQALAKAKIPVNCTLIFTPEQALLAAKAGAAFVSPFAGRVDDYLRTLHAIHYTKEDYYPAHGRTGNEGKMIHDRGIVSGIDLVRQCVQILRRYEFKTKVLAASLRNPRQVREAALVGADIATIPLSVIKGLLAHPKTAEGVEGFLRDSVPQYVQLTK